MRITLLVLLLLASAASASENVWRWIDSDGVTHYSDRPVPGATKVELHSINQATTAAPSPATPNSANAPPPASEGYRIFQISSPAPDQAFVNTGGQVSVTLQLDPGLLPGHTVTVLLDGQALPGSPGSALQYQAKDVSRGEHTVSAIIKDQSSQPVASAPSVRFYVRQPTVKDPTGSKLPPRPNSPQRSGR